MSCSEGGPPPTPPTARWCLVQFKFWHQKTVPRPVLHSSQYFAYESFWNGAMGTLAISLILVCLAQLCSVGGSLTSHWTELDYWSDPCLLCRHLKHFCSMARPKSQVYTMCTLVLLWEDLCASSNTVASPFFNQNGKVHIIHSCAPCGINAPFNIIGVMLKYHRLADGAPLLLTFIESKGHSSIPLNHNCCIWPDNGLFSPSVW